MLWPLLLLFLVAARSVRFSDQEIRDAREEVKEMFFHGYNNYLTHAFPDDELKPISCTGRRRADRGTLDDALGGFSLTLVDTLDTLLVMGEEEGFVSGVKLVVDHVTFDRDVTVSVFETTIRVLGGLLSSHVLIEDRGLNISWYDGQLLVLAEDIGSRLLPAFKTMTGIPVSRVNLQRGILPDEEQSTCTACAGTLLLEFGLLSRLTSNSTYEEVTSKAVKSLWEKRSSLGLLGNTINTTTGLWMTTDSGIGAGLDSFFEYLYKSYLYFDNNEYHVMWDKAYESAMKYLEVNGWFLVVDMYSGTTRYPWIESLSAFWPGLQVGIGDIASAQSAHKNYHALWRRYGGLPERYDITRETCVSGFYNYPLR
eukprot:TRINITY_DN680_c1_g2_i2.p1 TRINITY_DN680_c1_g2~~TRINITY_DN680_c1_g2_i2.p1  ORF type:complete len:368 (-),score=57.01 TRINITY_DN680_c1_g2_i2:36-1139(-)